MGQAVALDATENHPAARQRRPTGDSRGRAELLLRPFPRP
jgi:hypothetical protein